MDRLSKMFGTLAGVSLGVLVLVLAGGAGNPVLADDTPAPGSAPAAVAAPVPGIYHKTLTLTAGAAGPNKCLRKVLTLVVGPTTVTAPVAHKSVPPAAIDPAAGHFAIGPYNASSTQGYTYSGSELIDGKVNGSTVSGTLTTLYNSTSCSYSF
jgi:hypothetical protein